MSKFNIVLIEPEIPQNTGNIVRLCACTGANLYLVGKLGFSISDKHLKRAGLDYWDDVNITRVNSFAELKEQHPTSNFYFLTTKYPHKYTETRYKDGDFFVFGPESRGIDEKILCENSDFCRTIPMKEDQRSLNLSNSVAIVLYEAIRQIGI
ncbi:MAG: tRNA (cytidine(34)-2'-O)-methyltransferase [Candidatus Gastranaerophilales bacterium]|jgi:tRNA (cytidine/uridine-2'-O-)-methyltransferase|nr:tRNA (cytidine(34)-2'-O)-methyltransferase [Candidatus Gastranaerophilales bacterium]